MFLLIGSFCRGRPPTQKSSSNIMRIKYYTNSDRPNIGFKAKVSIATCGGTIHVTSTSLSTIHSPSYPGNYPNSADCMWTIIGPEGHYLQINFDTFDLPRAVVDCEMSDHLSISEPNVNRTDFELSTTLCGSSRVSTFETLTNIVRLRFISFAAVPSTKGFLAVVNASIEGKYDLKMANK